MSAALITNVDKKLLRTTKFPPEFDRKVDMERVNVPVIKKWVADEIARILNSDDDIVVELISNVLEESQYVSTPTSHHSNANANKVLAKNQRAANHDHWFPGKRRCTVRQIFVEAFAVRTDWSARCSSRTT